MKVRICYTVDVTDDLRRAIRNHYGEKGLATRKEVVRWFIANGESATDDIMYDLSTSDARDE